VGRSDGTVWLYLNEGQAGAPQLAAGAALLAGPEGQQTPLDVGSRATPEWLDWDGDGRPDLLSGALDGRVRVAINLGRPGQPLLDTPQILEASPGVELLVPGGRSSLVVWDEDGDGLWDLLSGNTDGQLFFARNRGQAGAPAFGDWEPVTCGADPLDLPGTQRTRPAAGDWDGDGLPDLLIGYGDGLVRLSLGMLAPPRVAIACEAGSLRLSWPAGAAADRFRVWRRILGEGSWLPVGETAGDSWSEPLQPGGALYRVTRIR